MTSLAVWGVRAAVALGLVAAPFFLSGFMLFLFIEILIIGLVATSLGLLTGFAGMPSLGHAAYMGVGGYTGALVATRLTDHGVIQLLVALVVAGLIAAATGWIAVRTRGVFFLMITLAFAELFFALSQSWGSVTGGSNGFTGIPRPSLIPGDEGVTLSGDVAFYFYTVVVVFIGYFAMRRITRSPFGAVLLGIRENEVRMRSLGFSVASYRLSAFAIAGAIAGYGGALLVQHARFISPSDLSFERSALLLIMVIVGGSKPLYGPMIGAGVIVFLERELSSRFSENWEIWLGGIFILVVYLFPEGIGGMLRRVGTGVERRKSPPSFPADSGGAVDVDASRIDSGETTISTEPTDVARIVLTTERVSKSYGSLQAVDGVSVALREGQCHALIGPNGAGKTTLFNLMSGALPATTGRISFNDDDITSLSEPQRARLGLSRTFQQASVFEGLSTVDNVRLALLRAAGIHRNTRSRVDAFGEIEHDALRLLGQVGLGEHAHQRAQTLSHGQRRHLELALALAPQPRVLLLDEPTAGMTQEEVRSFRSLIGTLSGDLTVLIVEHDMDVVFGLAQWVFVMNAGVLLEEGTPTTVRHSPAVREAYLGSYHDDEAPKS